MASSSSTSRIAEATRWTLRRRAWMPTRFDLTLTRRAPSVDPPRLWSAAMHRRATAVVCAMAALGVSACGGGSSKTPNPNAPEKNPPGDIPDNQAFVRFAVPGRGFSVKVPEGWSRIARGGAVVFTDKGYRPGTVTEITRTEGKVLRLTYLARAAANPVTGRSGIDAVERYFFFHRGRDAIVTLSGPKGADNVDPWRLVTNSLRWAR